MSNENMIACCGLDCSVCDVRLAPGNPEQAKHISDWINENFETKCKPEDIACTWCRGEREGHWSADCWILRCCVDDKGLEYCSDCDEFPCDKLVEWSKQSEKYGKAFERLEGIHRND